MSNNSIYRQTVQNLETLRLNQMKLHLDEVAQDVGTQNLSFSEGLLKLTNYEVDFKEKSAAQNIIHAAAFPFVKTLADYDFEFQPSVSESQMQEFCTLGFLERAENIVFLGSSGVGKTHLATAISIAAARHHNITYFVKCSSLLQQLRKAKLENRLEARLKHFNRYKLLIIDEIGYLPKLVPYEYYKYILKQMLEHMNDTNLKFVEDLLPWSERVKEKCSVPKIPKPEEMKTE